MIDVTPQLILRVAGIAALVIAALFAALAVHYYLTQNIKAVMDDLSGKARARGVAGTKRRSVEDAGRGGKKRASRDAVARQGVVEEAPAVADAEQAGQPIFAAQVDDEDDAGTVLVAPTYAGAAMSLSSEDDVATVVAPEDTQTGRVREGGAVDSDAAVPSSALFRMTRSLVMIHSQEVIAANEEL